jgi:Zn-finger nucleic acid-binding protein
MKLCFECDAELDYPDSPFLEMGHCPFCGGPVETIENNSNSFPKTVDTRYQSGNVSTSKHGNKGKTK